MPVCLSLSQAWLIGTSWTIARRAPLSVGIFRILEWFAIFLQGIQGLNLRSSTAGKIHLSNGVFPCYIQPQNIVDGIAEAVLVPSMMAGFLILLYYLKLFFFNFRSEKTDLRKTIRIYLPSFCRFSFSFHTVFSCGNKSVYIMHRERSLAFLNI